jgi:hypothetical protein
VSRASAERLPVTAAVRVLREHGVRFTQHPYDYEARGGTAVSARELGVDAHQVVKTLVMQARRHGASRTDPRAEAHAGRRGRSARVQS